jgi:hypothetical protein
LQQLAPLVDAQDFLLENYRVFSAEAPAHFLLDASGGIKVTQ